MLLKYPCPKVFNCFTSILPYIILFPIHCLGKQTNSVQKATAKNPHCTNVSHTSQVFKPPTVSYHLYVYCWFWEQSAVGSECTSVATRLRWMRNLSSSCCRCWGIYLPQPSSLPRYIWERINNKNERTVHVRRKYLFFRNSLLHVYLEINTYKK